MAVSVKGSQAPQGQTTLKGKNRVKKPVKVAAWVRSLSSQSASLISVTLCFPLEVIKTRMQIQGSRGITSHGLSSLAGVAQSEGIRGLYRGYSVTAFCTPMFHAMYFPMYEGFKDFFKGNFALEEGSFSLYATSAVVSGIISNCITNPFWMVRTRMQAETFRSLSEDSYRSKYPLNLFKTMRMIQQQEGFFTLYNGLSASMMGVMHPLIYFPLYEMAKIYFKKRWDTQNPDPDQLSSRFVLICAITCKAATSALTYPHEILRARMQDVRRYEQQGLPVEQRLKTGMVSVVQRLWREKGLISFYDGFLVNLMRISPSYAITFVLYEKFSLLFHRTFEGSATPRED